MPPRPARTIRRLNPTVIRTTSRAATAAAPALSHRTALPLNRRVSPAARTVQKAAQAAHREVRADPRTAQDQRAAVLPGPKAVRQSLPSKNTNCLSYRFKRTSLIPDCIGKQQILNRNKTTAVLLLFGNRLRLFVFIDYYLSYYSFWFTV